MIVIKVGKAALNPDECELFFVVEKKIGNACCVPMPETVTFCYVGSWAEMRSRTTETASHDATKYLKYVSVRNVNQVFMRVYLFVCLYLHV